MEYTLHAGISGSAQALVYIIVIAFFALWIKTIVEIATSKFIDDSKSTWLLIVILLGGLGMIVYYGGGGSKRVKVQDENSDIIDEF